MLFNIILIVHVITGSIGLILGTIITLRKKGDKLHKLIGKFFALAIVITGLSAFFLSYVHPNLFLFIVGVFTIYLSVSGYRMIQLKKVHLGQKPHLFDALLSSMMLFCSFIFFYKAIEDVIDKSLFGLVLILFGMLSMRLCYIDFTAYTGKITDKKYGLKNHIGRMTGAYIAAFTAFLVVNNTFLPPVLAWSLPGLIGGVFITRSIRKFN